MAVKARPFDVRHEPEDGYDIGWTETRWRLVDEDTGEIVDGAAGLGVLQHPLIGISTAVFSQPCHAFRSGFMDGLWAVTVR
ncbi:hypothetical protein [Bifidobacterium adolescentis]|uniref:Uncharacterized protein n=1 Tax=Bifidobacterium adolescentis TaxID=1680 RepID=A0A6I6QZ62_BIFAD|nr:hypothetical protein [Bifidobacterium adolescentis]QHB62634.1 hypothetical protein F3K97_04720 [Bifidobacterium adolescentis]